MEKVSSLTGLKNAEKFLLIGVSGAGAGSIDIGLTSSRSYV